MNKFSHSETEQPPPAIMVIDNDPTILKLLHEALGRQQLYGCDSYLNKSINLGELE